VIYYITLSISIHINHANLLRGILSIMQIYFVVYFQVFDFLNKM